VRLGPKLSTLAAVLALLAAPQAAAAGAPPGFIGISPQSAPGDSDYELMEEAGVRSVRLPLFWSQVEPASSALDDWTSFDLGVELAARHGMSVLPFVTASPAWVAPEPRLEPTLGAWQRRAWASFLRAAVRRYGAAGSFWRQNPAVPYRPVRAWEIWNEENIVTFGGADPERFAPLVRISGRIVHRYDPGARTILGGLFGRPLQIPPNVSSGDYLSRIYRAGEMKQYFDGIALHPYVADAAAMRGQILNLRRVMRDHRDAGTPIYVTELGWGSDGFETRWERGPLGQARELNQAFSMLSRHRRSWRIGGVWWFSWADAFGSCQFCDSAGLLTEQREAKPSWYRFNAWTGGDAETVPRASLAG
jgi:polysaccharide biosynthesis protein PslG